MKLNSVPLGAELGRPKKRKTKMCLSLDDPTMVHEDKIKTTMVGKLIGYKVVTDKNRSPFNRGNGFLWKKGLNISSRIHPYLKELEKRKKEVDMGFHFFADKAVALVVAKDFEEDRYWLAQAFPGYTGFKVLKVIIEPKHLVAGGDFNGDFCFVATKCSVKSLTGIK